MARTQSENYADIRREILRRTATLFARKGYPNSTIADIAGVNEMSRGLLYHYFASKEALLNEMLNTHLDMLLTALEAAATDGAGPEARFRNTVSTMVSINAGSKDLQIVLLHDLQNLADEDRDVIVEKQRRILDVLDRVIGDCAPALRADPAAARTRTMMFMGMINYTYLWYDPAGPVSPSSYARMVADTFLAGLP